jgi:hypothetical protein
MVVGQSDSHVPAEPVTVSWNSETPFFRFFAMRPTGRTKSPPVSDRFFQGHLGARQEFQHRVDHWIDL